MADLAPAPPSAPAVPLGGTLRRQAAQRPDVPAVVSPGRTLTFAELDAMVSHVAAEVRDALERAGAPPTGCAVAVSSDLGPEFAVHYHAVLRSGNVVVPLIPLLTTRGLGHVLGTSGARLAVVPPALAARLDPVRDGLPALAAILPPTLPPAGVPGPAVGADGDTDLDRPACIHFTSGTTGEPKAAVLSHRNLAVNAAQIADAHGLDPAAVTANHLPTYHPMHLNSALIAGATQVLCPDADAGDALRRAGRHRATHLYSLPVRLARLAARSDLASLRQPTLRVVASGGSPLAPALATRLADGLGVPVIQGYGLAETSPLTHSDRPESARPGSVGPPVADTGCRLVDVESRRPLPPGDPDALGEVQVRGPQVMLGYLDPAAPGTMTTTSAVDAEGWFSTGDVGRIDGEGRLLLVDRIKDVFKHDNWLVSPTTVERALLDRPEVADCCVIDRPDPAHGATAHALVVPAAGADRPALAAAVEAANAELPYYERVASFDATLLVPRSPQGKVPRAELRRRLAAGRPVVAPLPHPTPEGGPPVATMVNRFTVFGDTDEFERVWLDSADFMREQPGFIRFRLLRSVMDPLVYINVADWETVEDHQRVLQGPDFQTHIKELAALATPEPNLCSLVAEATAATS